MVRWVIRHGRLIFYLWGIFLIVLTRVLMPTHPEVSFWRWIIYMPILLFFGWWFINAMARREVYKATKVFNEQCDPYPLLGTINEQLRISRSRRYTILLLINKSAVLRDMGKFDEAIQLLEAIDIDQGGVSPIRMMLYYNNLADLYLQRGSVDQAKPLLDELKPLVGTLKNYKIREWVQGLCDDLEAEMEILSGNITEARKLLLQGNEPPGPPKQLIGRQYLLGRLYYLENNLEAAGKALQYVIANGNKLYDVERARELMKRIS